MLLEKQALQGVDDHGSRALVDQPPPLHPNPKTQREGFRRQGEGAPSLA